MKDKIFLTGARQIGKSTVIAGVIAKLSCRKGGFRTAFSDEAHQELLLTDIATGESAVVMRRDGCGRTVYNEAFDELGTAALSEEADLRIVDELGFLEQNAAAFQAAVLRALDANTPMLGVVRQGASGWLDAVRSHPRVQLLTVTEENRGEIAEQVLEMLAKLGLQ